jgi:hypothetical protein
MSALTGPSHVLSVHAARANCSNCKIQLKTPRCAGRASFRGVVRPQSQRSTGLVARAASVEAAVLSPLLPLDGVLPCRSHLLGVLMPRAEAVLCIVTNAPNMDAHHAPCRRCLRGRACVCSLRELDSSRERYVGALSLCGTQPLPLVRCG